MPNGKSNFFRERRDQLGMTQREIGNLLGITDKAVGAWEIEVAAPRLHLSPKLAEVYRVPESRIHRAIIELSASINRAKEAAAK